MANAYSEGNHTQGDRYNAFYSCLTWNSCEQLRELEKGIQTTFDGTANLSGCDKDELESLKKAGFTTEEIKSHCRPTKSVGFSGQWKTNWGMMKLNQSGNGNYTHDKGKISGSVRGKTLIGTLSEAPTYSPPNDAGDVEFILSTDGNTFSGKWRYGSKGNWKSGWEKRHNR